MIDHKYTRVVVCPWCGHLHQDDLPNGPVTWDCEACEKAFRVEVDIDVTYSTTKEEPR